jgi:DNA-binding LacI/PurR family transcriptional regulator
LRKKRITVYDVARELGLSAGTVSRVLNNSILIGEETRAQILKTARRLGYRKRVIKKQKNRAILNIRLVLPAGRQAYLHLFYDTAELIGGLHEGFGDVRINIITRLNEASAEPPDAKKLGDIDGSVYAFSEPAGGPAAGEREGPAILINRDDGRFDHIALDNLAGMRRLFEAAAAVRADLRPCFLGFKPVAYINERRKQACLEAARGLGLRPPEIYEFDSLAEITPRFLRERLAAGRDAFFCLNDVVAAWVHGTAQREGIRFPEDAALAGFDNSPVLDLVPQRIDTIDLSVREMARRAGAWLRRRIIERELAAEHTTFAGAYLPGETLGRPAAKSGRKT